MSGERAAENCPFYPACYVAGDCDYEGWKTGQCGLPNCNSRESIEPAPTSTAPSQVPAHPADMRERVAQVLDPKLFDGDPVTEHLAASPLRVDVAKARVYEKVDAILSLLVTSVIDGREGDSCHDCGGSGVYFGHTADCDNDSCALNGDMDSCGGEIETCHCALGNSGQVA